MSVKNNKGVAAQALLEMDSIVSAIKEESKKTLGSMLNEAVKDALRESVEDEEEKDYEVVDDDEKNDAEDENEKDSEESSSSDVSEDENDEIEGPQPQAGAQDPNAMQAGAEQPQAGAEEAPVDAGIEGEEPAEPQDGEGEEGWDEFSNYQVGDNTYDLTGENDYDNVVKIYKLLKDDDQVVVKKEGNTIQLQDGQAGTEYVIDLGGDEPTGDMGGEEDPSAELNEGFDIAGLPDDEDDEGEIDDIPNGSQPWDDETSFEDEFDNFDDDEFGDDSFDSDELEGEKMNTNERKQRGPIRGRPWIHGQLPRQRPY